MSLRRRVAELLIRASQNGADYLISLNLKKLNENKRPADVEPRAYYEKLKEQAAKGPIFSEGTITFVQRLETEMDKRELQWFATNIELASNEREHTLMLRAVGRLQYMLDWIRAENPELRGLTFTNALTNAEEWHEQFKGNESNAGPYETRDVDLDFSDGYAIVKVPPKDLKTEGDLMGHCVGGKNYFDAVSRGSVTIYSLRDRKNKPHVTIEVYEHKTHRSLVQIQGKENQEPVEKYRKYVSDWIDKQKFKVNDVLVANSTNPEFLSSLIENPAETESEVSLVRSVAKNPHTPEDALDKLAKSSDNSHVLYTIISNSRFPLEKTQALLESKTEATFDLTCNLIAHYTDDLKLLDLIMAMADKRPELIAKLGRSIASNIAIPPARFEEWAASENPKYRGMAASSSKLSGETYRKLSKDKDHGVTRLLAGNLSCPITHLKVLAKSPDKETREILVNKQGSRSIEIVRLLVDDEDEYIGSQARRKVKFYGRGGDLKNFPNGS